MGHKNTHGAVINTVSNGMFSMLFHSDCVFFEGHFPDNPIVPGVLLLDTIYDHLLKTGVENISAIDNARFYKTVLPNEKVIVKVNDRVDKVVCTVKNDVGKILKVSYIKAQ